MISVKNLRKKFGDKEILKGIDLDVHTGESVAIIGPSGSGKTTLLRCLNFLETADDGQITIGEDTASFAKIAYKEKIKMRKKTSMVLICSP